MAHLITVQILVNSDDEKLSESQLFFVLQQLQNEAQSDPSALQVRDAQVMAVDAVNPTLENQLAHHTYAPGSAFGDWVVFSPSEDARNGDGYWSNTYGWTSLDLATKFDACDYDLPQSAGRDAVWRRAPYHETT